MSGADPTLPSEPSRSVEVELKFDVDDDTPVPDWTGLPGVASVGDPELRELDARYFDSDDLALSRAGYALRRRTGGPDEGWHIKGPRVGDGRTELHWPLGADDVVPDVVAPGDAAWPDVVVPDDVRSAVSAVADAATLSPLARIRNTRTAYALLSPDGGVVAEFVDDRVAATDARTGMERAWREWEFELGPAAPASGEARVALLTAAEAAVHAAGGRAAASDSKLGRTLGH
ncbi:CYTH domain-containing protein [Microbacterium sp. CFBP9034]|uniref:CYTH domain-containing protein n=1 Tax=Microbacterium sp. CFBP9034 TaxID=3096540 RepID=UPI002A6A380D|nr:CYTH domain-containing protein [Microbacterium sp. CFBP9034]MDY0910026.1 CYTH domain-containing protein [Microbacterium sp. CFBP9034]